MKSYLQILAVTILIFSCSDDLINDSLNNTELGNVCEYRTDILPPLGFEIDTIGEVKFNGSVKSFQFLDEKIGYALASNNVGGYVEIFKTIDGGETWTDLEIGIDQFPRNMIFKDENVGLITVNDVTGCPNNCQNKTVLLKTENGGQNWKEIEISNLNGILYHPQFDKNGNLYASLFQIDRSSVIVRSTDNGVTWSPFYTSPELGFQLITFSYKLFEDRLYVPTKDGNIEVVNTLGKQLKILEIGNNSIYDLEIIDKNNFVIALSGSVMKSVNGGDTWETITPESARIIGFENTEKGLILQKQSVCPTDVYQVNDLLASTDNGGSHWNEASSTTTNLRINFADSQQMGENIWYTMLNNYLVSIYEVQLK